jgi:hypothetical protein
MMRFSAPIFGSKKSNHNTILPIINTDHANKPLSDPQKYFSFEISFMPLFPSRSVSSTEVRRHHLVDLPGNMNMSKLYQKALQQDNQRNQVWEAP